MAKKKCPGCLTSLELVSNEQVFYICEECGCNSIHMKNFEKATSPMMFRRFRQSLEFKITSEKVACGSCSAELHAIEVKGEDGNVEIDICSACNLIWFDMDEMSQFLKSTGEHSELVIPAAIRSKLMLLDDRDESGTVVPRYKSFKFSTSDYRFSFLKRREAKTSNWLWLPALFGLPVEGQNRLSKKPWNTWSLIFSMIIIGILDFHWLHLTRDLGFFAYDPYRLGGITLITSFFLHGGYLHLIGNMYFLWTFGDNTEDSLGKGNFIFMIFLSLLLSKLLFTMVADEYRVPLVGASGGISAMIAYYSFRFPRAYLFKNLFFLWWIRFPAILYTGFWIIIQFWGLKAQVAGITNVSYVSHVAGIIVGAAFAWMARKKMIEVRY